MYCSKIKIKTSIVVYDLKIFFNFNFDKITRSIERDQFSRRKARLGLGLGLDANPYKAVENI